MKVVVGIGNPGLRYEVTRHNVGWLALDRLMDRWHARGPEKRFNGEIYEAQFKNEKVLLVKPQTFMNLSGQCVGPLFGFFKLQASDLIVLQDELDLPAMSVRIKTGGGSAGHNGIKSISAALGNDNNDYHRVRIGIGKPQDRPDTAKIPTDKYVLMSYGDEELKELDGLFDRVAEAVELLVEGRVRDAQQIYNQQPKAGDK